MVQQGLLIFIQLLHDDTMNRETVSDGSADMEKYMPSGCEVWSLW